MKMSLLFARGLVELRKSIYTPLVSIVPKLGRSSVSDLVRVVLMISFFVNPSRIIDERSAQGLCRVESLSNSYQAARVRK